MDKKINERKVDFIICYNDEVYLQECMKYINYLDIPEGIEIKILGISGAKSMCAGYQAAMQESDAKYKVYLHQDTFIVNRNFIQEVIGIFQSYPEYGMLGVIGTDKMVKDANYWMEWDMGVCYGNSERGRGIIGCNISGKLKQAIAVDGICIVTQYDIPWREDRFDGFDFYDISQSMEFQKAGYKVGVPYQEIPWCIHDCGLSKLTQYDDYRAVFCEEYAEYGYRYQDSELNEAAKNDIVRAEEIKYLIYELWKRGRHKELLDCVRDIERGTGVQRIHILSSVIEIMEQVLRREIPDYFRIEENTLEELCNRMLQCKFFLMRMEEGFPLDMLLEELEYIAGREGDSIDDYYIIAKFACRNPEAVMQKLSMMIEVLCGKKTSYIRKE